MPDHSNAEIAERLKSIAMNVMELGDGPDRDAVRLAAERLENPEPQAGVMHPVDKAFSDLAVKERDHERVRSDRLERERDAARAKCLTDSDRQKLWEIADIPGIKYTYPDCADSLRTLAEKGSGSDPDIDSVSRKSAKLVFDDAYRSKAMYEKAQARVLAIRAIHTQTTLHSNDEWEAPIGQGCSQCGPGWPCATVKLLDVFNETEKG